MIRNILILALLLCIAGRYAQAQGEENIWVVGRGYVVDFSGPLPVFAANPPTHQTGNIFPGYYSTNFEGEHAAICDATGNLRFLMLIISNTSRPQEYRLTPKVFDATGYSMPHGDINGALNGTFSSESPMILPWPEQPDKYFIFYTINSGLLYSVVDMRLNNGLGDVDTTQKDILLRNFYSIVGAKYTAIQGCDAVWLVVRSRVSNQYFSFRITKQGIDPDPVVSDCGLLPSVSDYLHPVYNGGRLAASPDGKTLAAATKRGIELYDFEKCSGRISNPRLIDDLTFLGVCFSQNSQVLYATSRERPPYDPGRVYQYDLNQPSPQAVTNSRVLVLENPRKVCASLCYCGSCFCDTNATYIGDLKRAPNGKIYMTNNYKSCGPVLAAPPTAPMPFPISTVLFDSSALHVIHEPDRLGWACRPELHVLTLRVGGSSGTDAGMWFSRPVVLPPPDPDTIPGVNRLLAACFTDSLLLSASETGKCYRWEDGTTDRERTVYASGIYTVGYFTGACGYTTDTFRVVFTSMPRPGPAGYSCVGSEDGILQVLAARGDTTRFQYRWLDTAGQILRTISSDTGDRIPGLAPGDYILEMSSGLGCDTFLRMSVLPLPRPVASFETDSIACKGMPLLFRNTGRTPFWTWYFGDGTKLDKGVEPEHSYTFPGRYNVLLSVKNIEGCSDTAARQITITDFRVELTASPPQVVNRNEPVLLQSNADVPYMVTAWLPQHFFPDQQAYYQRVNTDTSRQYFVVAASELGCADTASVTVPVDPFIMVPNAFTPDGDGRNDYFRPVIRAGTALIRSFCVFDRWGRQVWAADGAGSMGWDGMYKGKPAEAGVYFYRLEIETGTGNNILQNGDVTLMR